jgi:DNA-directed RNA polymerase beta subunit
MGDGLFNKNAVRSMSSVEDTIDKLHSTLYRFGSTATTYAEKIDEVMKAFDATTLDPWTTKITVGRSYDTVSPNLLLDSTRKMLGVASGDVEPDKRDAIYFKSIYGIDDMVEFALNKSGAKVRNKLAFRLGDPNKDIQSILSRPVSNFDSLVSTRFNVSDLSYTPDQLNPLDMFNTINEVTLMGEGGIGDTHSIPVSTRSLDDSYIGFIDPLQTPTNNKIGVNMVLTSVATKRGKELATRVKQPHVKAPSELKTAVELYDKYVALPEEYIVTSRMTKPRHTKVNAIYKGKIVQVEPGKIDYIFPANQYAHSITTLMVPLIEHNSPERQTFSAKQMSAAIPLINAESPLVHSTTLGNVRTGEESKDATDVNVMLDRLFSIIVPESLPKGGTVTKIQDGTIYITPTGGGKAVKVQLLSKLPAQFICIFKLKPSIEVGQKVKLRSVS